MAENDPDHSGVYARPTPPISPKPRALATRVPLDRLADDAERYVQQAHSEHTRKAYQGDWAAFATWCAANSLRALPAPPSTLELYLAHLAQLGRKASTIRRARIAIGLAHGHNGEERPDKHARIRALERGIGRVHGAREEGAPPLLDDDLKRVVAGLGDSPREVRDRAMLLLGFSGAFRGSELAGLNLSDLTFTSCGLVVALRRSKSDPLGLGEPTEIPFGSTEGTCPVRAVRRWIERVGRPSGPPFRVVLGASIEHQRVHPRAISRALQRAAARAGLEAPYSSHSLRCGLATSAYAKGATKREIQIQGRWRDERSVDRYIRMERVPGRRNVAEGLNALPATNAKESRTMESCSNSAHYVRE